MWMAISYNETLEMEDAASKDIVFHNKEEKRYI